MLALLYFSAVGAIFYTMFLRTPKAEEDPATSIQQAANPHGQ